MTAEGARVDCGIPLSTRDTDALPALRLALATLLLTACSATPERPAPYRAPFVRVLSKYAAATARPEGCRMVLTAHEPPSGQRLRKLADLQLTGSALDRARAEKLLAAKACSLGAATLRITDEDYGPAQGRGSVEATAYGFHSPVQILPSGLELEAEPRPLDCRIVFFRTQRPEAPYDELAGLNLNVKPEPYALAPNAATSQERLLGELRQAACHLGADALVISHEQYDVPTIGSRISGTAILFRESPQRRRVPGSQEL